MDTTKKSSVGEYKRAMHSARLTSDYVFNQLIPYIGNKRKLLNLIHEAIDQTGINNGIFLDIFAGTGVVSRFAKKLGYQVIANDWEPYSYYINACYIKSNHYPAFSNLGGYAKVIDYLNNLEPRVDWVTEHLCPDDDYDYDVNIDRMFYMKKNGMRLDAIREKIYKWKSEQLIDEIEEACLLAPLLYQASYTSNTSGVFKGFHNGWGGKTKTALYRIAGDLELHPAVFFDNGKENRVYREDAQKLAEHLQDTKIDIVYLDPPYNQHPYGSNYHVLNSIALWDKPAITKKIIRGNKSAIRKDWRTERRSAYNHKNHAILAYRKLLATINGHYILTSYSTDGFIGLDDMIRANLEGGYVRIIKRPYKRYRVSSTRFSSKPVNVEFIIVLDTSHKKGQSVDELVNEILAEEVKALHNHPELNNAVNKQGILF